MKKTRILLCGIGVCAVLSGCSSAAPELTREENDILTEYTVNLLLKYDKYYNSRIVDLSAYEEEQESEQETAPEEIAAPQEAETENAGGADESVAEDAPAEEMPSTIEEFCGISGFTFQYAGCDLKKEYPDIRTDSAEVYFAIQASPGAQLLVARFMANNQSGSDQELNMPDTGLKTRLSVNGESSKNTLNTMLPNELRSYKGIVAAGSAVELVAIIEVPDGTYVENLSLLLRNDSGSTEIALSGNN